MNRITGSGLPDGHALHDRLLVARAADGDLDAEDRAGADALMAACAECRALAGDLAALRVTASTLPAARRPRDFRLSAEQAERVRGGFLRRVLAPLGGPAFAFVQPLAGVVAALGLFLLVVNSLPMAMSGATGGATEPQMAAEGGASAVASPGSTAVPPRAAGGESPGASAAAGGTRGSQPVGGGASLAPLPSRTPASDKATDIPGAASPVATGSDSGLEVLSRDRLSSSGPNLPTGLLLGLVLLVAGLGLFVLRMYARREDPLLR
jgi:hypothetical protein